MSNIPEGTPTVTAEGPDVRTAIATAAQELGVDASAVSFQLDLSFFRNAAGGSVARQSVRIVAWHDPDKAAAPAEAPKAEPKAPKAPRKPRAPKAESPEAEAEAPAPTEAESAPAPAASALTKTEASEIAQAWVQALLPLMGLEGTVQATGDDTRIHLEITVDQAGRLIGRRGSTLAAVRHLLSLILAPHGTFTIDVDIPDQRGEGKPEREKPAPRARKSESSHTDRSSRSRGRDRDRDRDRSKGGSSQAGKSDYSEEQLQALSKRASERALETGRPVTINLVLNSYDRRIVHVAVAEIEGVRSKSVLKDGKKYIQVTRASDDLLLEESDD